MGMTCCKSYNTAEDEYSERDYSRKPNAHPEYNDGENAVDNFQIPIQWNCIQDCNQFQIPVDSLKFNCEKCVFEATGNDEQGKFDVIGNIELSGNVIIKQTYKDTQWKRFEGKFTESIIEGKWKNHEHVEGTFRLELITTIWHNENSLVALKNLQEFVGVVKFPYGYGIVSGTPLGESEVKLNVIFGNKKTGSFQFTIADDCLKGKLISPDGEQDLNLELKNEFE